MTLPKPTNYIYGIYAIICFVATMLIVLPFIAIFSLAGKRKGGNLIYTTCRLWGIAWMFLVGIFHRTAKENQPKKGHQYIFVANHISYLDIPSVFLALKHHHFRILGKIEMKKIPIFGFIYSRAVVMVDRSSPQHRAKSVRELKNVLHQDISIFLFPEGTFNETGQPLKEFYDGAFRLAIETNTPIKPILFLDTNTRMHYKSVFSLNPGRSRAIYLPEVPVEGLDIKDLAALKQKVYTLMQQALIHQKAPWIHNPIHNS